MSAPIRLCGNEDHTRRPRAVARVSWPKGPYRPVDACASCRDFSIRQAMDDVDAILVEPIAEAYGFCPVCRGVWLLRMDGTLRAHPISYGRTCEGRGQKPAEGDPR